MGSRSLLVSDVDDTLLGDDHALHQLAEWLAPRRDRLLVAYASGRFVESIRQSVRDTPLPEPDAVIGGVGSEIWLAGEEQLNRAWPASFSSWKGSAVREALQDHRGLELQPPHLLSPYKISFYAYDLKENDIERIRRHLAREVGAVEVIYSSARDLDVLPAGVNKGSAARWLARSFEVLPKSVMVAGDSGNDLSLFQQGFRGIAIANAVSEIRELSGDDVYLSPFSRAAGVLDGLQHWLESGIRDTVTRH